MCGILGSFVKATDGVPAFDARSKGFLAIKPRGPDGHDSKHFQCLGYSVFLAHSRLSIIELSMGPAGGSAAAPRRPVGLSAPAAIPKFCSRRGRNGVWMHCHVLTACLPLPRSIRLQASYGWCAIVLASSLLCGGICRTVGSRFLLRWLESPGR